MNNILTLSKKVGISISEVARRIDMQPHTLRRYARGDSEPKLELANKIAEIFGCTATEVLGIETVAGHPLGKIPLYGSASAGLGSDITNMDRAVDHINRPSFLISQANAYAVFVVGESMEPRFRSGEVLFVDPDAPVRKGADVIVQTIEDEELTAIIKTYISSDDHDLKLQQLNPNKELLIPKTKVTSIHAVQGSWYRL
tara:strand:+ start:118 stop:714 length:597 start_codon:yes stop_codon:yes gene_type:complete